MFSTKYLGFLCGLLAVINCVSSEPDSAGIVEMVDGLAYGGIPYGSISGMLSKSQNQPWNRNFYYPGFKLQSQQQPSAPIIVTPNLRASGLAARQNGPVQIYNLPGVVSPGVVGTFSQIGY